MQNKIKTLFISVCVLFGMTSAYCADTVFENVVDVIENVNANEEFSADAIEDYNVDGSLFQQITDLEQEKVLMQLEKERAQLNLDLDRLAAEKIKLHMEIDTLSGRAEQQQQEAKSQPQKQQSFVKEEPKDVEIEKNYKLLNVFGAGSQLQATVQDLSNGQNKRISVGKELDGYTVKSISLDDGVVFIKDGEIQTLNVGK